MDIKILKNKVEKQCNKNTNMISIKAVQFVVVNTRLNTEVLLLVSTVASTGND